MTWVSMDLPTGAVVCMLDQGLEVFPRNSCFADAMALHLDQRKWRGMKGWSDARVGVQKHPKMDPRIRIHHTKMRQWMCLAV